MKKCCLLFAFSLSAIFIIPDANALPRFALIRGEGNCLGCHTNPTGGQLRSAGGEAFSINDLPMWKRGDKFTSELSDGIRIGGDFRSQLLMFSQTTPLYNSLGGDTVGNGPKVTKRGDTTTHLTSFHSMSLAFELDIKATNTLHGFFRYDPLGLTQSEGWALLHFVHSSGEIIASGKVVTNAYVKLGSFLPAFGIRFDDHTTYVKGGTASLSGFNHAGFFWTPGYRDVGAEIGTLLFDHIGIVAGMFNGLETTPIATFSTDPTKAYCVRLTTSGEIIENVLAGELGFSEYLHNHPEGNMTLSAFHFSLRAGPVTILSEYDMGKNIITSGGVAVAKANALCIEGAVNATKGLDAILRYETFKNENAAGVTGAQVKSRITIGAQWFPMRFLEIRPEYRIAATSIPNEFASAFRDDITENTFLVQTHVFF
jgi:hypothetical protein